MPPDTFFILRAHLGKKVEKQKNLKALSTFRIGGKAEYFFEAKNGREVVNAFKVTRALGIPFHLITGGSNIVFTDDLLKGLLVRLRGGKLIRKGKTIQADPGVPLKNLISLSIQKGLRGLETLSGIPGTVGGAIVGNAGAYGHNISEPLLRVQLFDGKRIRWVSKHACRFFYRDSIFKHREWILLKAGFSFQKGNKRKLQKVSRDIIEKRKKKYRPSLKTPGSFFKNIVVKDIARNLLKKIDQTKIIEGKLPAGWLLEQVGAKGLQKGGIIIAPFHANLFINRGKGRAKDVKNLSALLKKKVYAKFGILLEEEIRYID